MFACLKVKSGIGLLTLLLVALLLVQSDYVLAESAGLETRWSKTYDTGGASSIIQTNDGGFMIAGANRTRLPTAVFTMYNYTTLLVKTDDSGEAEWTKTYPGTNGVEWVMQTTDSGYILLGRNVYSGWLSKTDSQGNLEWNRTIDLQQVMGFTVTEDGSYIIAGYVENPSTAYNYALILKYSANGDLLWQKTFQGNIINVAATVILQSSDSRSYYVAGSWNMSFWFVKLNSDGNVVWNQTYSYQDASGVSPLTFHSIAQTKDNGYILSGTDGRYAWLVKTDSEGNEDWHQRYDFVAFISAITSDSGYVAFTNTEMFKTDTLGNVQCSEFYNSTDPASTQAYSGIVTNDGGFAVAGSLGHPNSALYFWAAKFAPESASPPAEAPSPFPTTWIVIAIIIVVIVIVGLLVYFKKYKAATRVSGRD